jgi:hypothetical protein
MSTFFFAEAASNNFQDCLTLIATGGKALQSGKERLCWVRVRIDTDKRDEDVPFLHG